MVCDLVFSAVFYSNYTSEQSRELAVKGITIAASLDDEMAYVDGTESPDKYMEYRDMLRHICTTFGLKYLYIKRPVENGTRGMYVFTVAADPEEDIAVQKDHPYGKLSSREFNEYEKRALAGETNIPAWREKNDYGSVYSYVYPLKDENDKVIALIGADYEESHVNNLTYQNVARLIIILSVTLLLIVIDRRILEPLRRISESMDQFAKEKKQQEPLGIRSHDEIRLIADSYENMSRDILSYIDDIKKMTAERMQTDELMDEVKGIIFRLAKDSPKKLKIILACEEINTNIVSYSGADSIEYICALSGGGLTVRISDNGKSFAPLHAEIAEKEFEEYDTGGMGINLVKRTAEKLVYRRIGGRNIIKMEFDLQ